MFNKYEYLKRIEGELKNYQEEYDSLNQKEDDLFKRQYDKSCPDEEKNKIREERFQIYDRLDELEALIHDIECELQPKVYLTHHVGTDNYPYELIERRSEKVLWVREMDFEIGDAYDGCSTNCTPNIKNPIEEIRQHKNGLWYIRGSKCCPFSFSKEPHGYRDPSF